MPSCRRRWRQLRPHTRGAATAHACHGEGLSPPAWLWSSPSRSSSSFCFLLGLVTEEHCNVAAQVIDRLGGDLGAPRRLREDEGALEDGLGVESEAARGPFRLGP